MSRLSLSLFLCFVFSAQAIAATEINWDDLIPESAETVEDPFAEMPDEQLMSLSMVARYREILDINGELSPAGQEELELELEKLEEWGVDFDALLEKRNEIIEVRTREAEATRPELNGKEIKIPGYLLPLEYDEEKVIEFLLVPYVGACIHSPPPPPNQIVHVTSEFGFVSSDLYTPVWVEGEMKTEAVSAALSFVDGSSDIPVAYTIDAQEVTLYQ